VRVFGRVQRIKIQLLKRKNVHSYTMISDLMAVDCLVYFAIQYSFFTYND
jgi:hypothetical protein